jgi:hypothetical protein
MIRYIGISVGFEEGVEQDAVERAEHADHQARQDQERAHVLVDAFGDDFPGRDDHHEVDEGGEQHEPEGDAVDADVVVHVEALDPAHLLDKLHGGAAGFEAGHTAAA